MSIKYIGITAVASAMVLVGCSSDSKNSGFDAGELIVGESATGTPADDVSTTDLRNTAASLASSSLGLNINEVLGIGIQDNTQSTTTGLNGMNIVTVADKSTLMILSCVKEN